MSTEIFLNDTNIGPNQHQYLCSLSIAFSQPTCCMLRMSQKQGQKCQGRSWVLRCLDLKSGKEENITMQSRQNEWLGNKTGCYLLLVWRRKGEKGRGDGERKESEKVEEMERRQRLGEEELLWLLRQFIRVSYLQPCYMKVIGWRRIICFIWRCRGFRQVAFSQHECVVLHRHVWINSGGEQLVLKRRKC